MRWALRGLIAVLAVAVMVNPAAALMIANRPPLQRAASADVVVVGKVTAIEKELVEVVPFPGSPNKVAYKIAVVKVQTPLAGVGNATHIKVAFVPRPAPNPNPQPVPIRPRPGIVAPELQENDEFLFFLSKHPDGSFYAMSNMSPPISVNDADFKKTLEAVTKVTKLLADPMKGLKSANAEERFLTAGALITHYRRYPDFASTGVEQVEIPADETRLILKALLERDWAKPDASGLAPTQLFFSLGLNEKDSWVMPKPRQGVLFNTQLKDEFAKWLDGPGKDYQIKKNVAKKP